MKKLILILLGICTTFSTVEAMTINVDGTYTTEKGAILTEEEYEILKTKFHWRIIDKLNKITIESLLNDTAKVDYEEIYTVTTDTIDRNGNIIDSKTITVTESEALSVVTNPNIRVTEDGNLYDFSNECASTYAIHQNEHSTSSKKVRLAYIDTYYGDYHEVVIDAI